MPILKLATICEKVIVDANGVPSLIGLFSQFNVGVPKGTTFPANAVTPKEWALFCLWECSSEEVGCEFHQIFEVTSPGDEQLPPQTIKFKPEPGKLRQNVIGNSQAVPIGRAGKVTVTTRVEYEGKVVVPPVPFTFDVVYVETPA
jgi:hypothetical protein